jgi:hypothetical protein
MGRSLENTVDTEWGKSCGMAVYEVSISGGRDLAYKLTPLHYLSSKVLVSA